LDSTLITCDNIKSKIVWDEQQRIMESGNSFMAFYAKATKKGKSKKPAGNDKKCTHCKIKGHDVKECRKLKREREKAASPKTDSKATETTTAPPTATAKVAVTESTAFDDDSDNDLPQTPIPVFHAHIPDCSLPDLEVYTYPKVERVFQAHAELKSSPDYAKRWIMDSGTSRTMTCHHRWFQHYKSLSSPVQVILGNNSSILATGIGRIPVQMQTDSGWNDAILQDALYVPDLHGNLLSVPQLTRRGSDVLFSGDTCRLLTQGAETACLGKLRENLYIMDI
jgi:hypothetical protein